MTSTKKLSTNALYNAPFLNFWEWLLVPFIIGLMTVSHYPGLSKFMILYGIIITGLFIAYFLRHELALQPEVIIYFSWIVWSLCGLYNAVNQTLYFAQLMTIFQIGILLFLVTGITALRQNMSVVMFAVVIGGFIVALSSYNSFKLQLAQETDSKMQAAGLIGNANEFAYNLLFFIFAAFFFWESKSSFWWRIIQLAVVVVSVIGIIYSGSRKGFLCVLVFMLLWFLFCQAKRFFKKPIVTLTILLIMAGGVYYTIDYVMSSTYLGKRFEDLKERGSHKRAQMYIDGFNMIRENPIFGVGLNNYRVLSSSGLYSHSYYIEVAANTGIVGFILYFSIYLVLWRRLCRIKLMTNDPQILYINGLLRAAIVTILLIGVGAPLIISKLTWSFLAGAIGYSWSVERTLLSKLQTQYKGFPHAHDLE